MILLLKQLETELRLLFFCVCLPLGLYLCRSAFAHPGAAPQSEYRVKVESENGEQGRTRVSHTQINTGSMCTG